MAKKQEESLQIAVSKFIKLQYPKVVFSAESSGIRLPNGLAVKAKAQRSTHTLPDMWILEPKGLYHGLIIELKKSREDLYLKDNVTFNGSKHVQDQLKTLNLLGLKGYRAIFCCGLDEAIDAINIYMKLR